MSMITVLKGNVELSIDDSDKERYLKLGYSVIDTATGKVIEEAPITDIGALQTRVAELLEENKKLKQELEKAQGETSTKTKKTTTKSAKQDPELSEEQ